MSIECPDAVHLLVRSCERLVETAGLRWPGSGPCAPDAAGLPWPLATVGRDAALERPSTPSNIVQDPPPVRMGTLAAPTQDVTVAHGRPEEG